MSSFNACFLGEIKKLSLGKKYLVLTIISAVFCIFVSLIASLAGKISNTEAASLLPAIPSTVLPFFMQFVLPLVASMAACDLFASEFRDRSIKSVLIRPVSRTKVYTAKLLAVFAICALMLLFIFAVSALCELLLFASAGGLWHALLSYLLDLIPLLVLVLMMSAINQFTKSSTSAMFLCIIIYILAKAAGIFAPILDSLLPTGYLQWHKLWLGSILPFGALFSKCLLLLGYGITFFSCGYYIFLKREY